MQLIDGKIGALSERERDCLCFPAKDYQTTPVLEKLGLLPVAMKENVHHEEPWGVLIRWCQG